MTNQPGLYTAPVFLGTAFLLFGVALIEKLLNLFGASIPVINVFPSQVLGWAVTLLMFEIALTLRQLVETTRQRELQENPAQDRRLH
jgi:energy-coupling factor transporter transmembrane protein EcfT